MIESPTAGRSATPVILAKRPAGCSPAGRRLVQACFTRPGDPSRGAVDPGAQAHDLSGGATSRPTAAANMLQKMSRFTNPVAGRVSLVSPSLTFHLPDCETACDNGGGRSLLFPRPAGPNAQSPGSRRQPCCPASFARKHAAATAIEALGEARPASCSSERRVVELAPVEPGVEPAAARRRRPAGCSG